ncbi:DUF4145 domain-containing protein [Leuconostoc mesenteroides]|uniref:DUF4145 domain-containing protein n=1 Tax=Leuconostoc mesenteroides TaxID=1245 RepID=UPI0039BD7DAD
MSDLYYETSYRWNSEKIMEATYKCGYCGSKITSDEGMYLGELSSYGQNKNSLPQGVFICTNCKLPSFIYNGIQVPGINFGNSVNNIPDNVNSVYEEARKSFSVGAYTGVILLCRKLLMHVGVNFGAEENKNFVYYVNYLKDNHYVSQNSGEWIDSIRKFGNVATHQIVVNTKEDAEKMIKFCEMLLKMNYEYPALMNEEN